MSYNKNNRKKIVGGLALTLILLTGCVSGPKESIVNEEYVFDPIAVKVEAVVDADVYDTIFTIGEIKSNQQYQANAMTSGDVIEVFFKIGDYVEKDQVLFTIEAKDFEIDKNTKISQAANSVSQAKLAYENAVTNFTKYQSLFSSGAASQADLDTMRTQMDNAKISYNNASQSYTSVANTYKTQSENYAVTSPVSGVITNENVAVGMFATTQNGFTIDVIEEYEVKTQVASKYINDIEVGQAVEVYISTLDELIKGTISSISLSATSGTYPVEITLDETSQLIRPGMFADIWIIKGTMPNGIWIPSQALLQSGGESFVYLADENKAQKVSVEVLSLRGDEIAVRGELTKDTILITFGKEFVMDGAPILIKE